MADWGTEMFRMLGTIELQMAQSLRTIKSILKSVDETMGPGFKQYFLENVNERAEATFDRFDRISSWEDERESNRTAIGDQSSSPMEQEAQVNQPTFSLPNGVTMKMESTENPDLNSNAETIHDIDVTETSTSENSSSTSAIPHNDIAPDEESPDMSENDSELSNEFSVNKWWPYITSGLAKVQSVFENGANINAIDKHGMNALHCASKFGDLNIVEYLVGIGGDIHAKDKEGYTALHWALEKGALGVIKYLFERGVDINAKDNLNWTALHWASKYGNVKIVKFLVENGAEINAADDDGYTPLHLSSEFGKLNVAKFLVEHGADLGATIDPTVDGGHSALDIAIKHGCTKVAKMLKDALRRSL